MLSWNYFGILQIKVNWLIQCYVLDSSLLMPRALELKCWNWEYCTWTNRGKLNDSMLCPQFQHPVTIQGQIQRQSVLCVICSSSQILASYPGHMGGGKVLLFFPCVAWVQGYTNTLKKESTIEKGYTTYVTVMICVCTWQSAQSSSSTWGRCSVGTLVSWAWQQSWRKTPWVLTGDTQSQWKWGWAQCLEGKRKLTKWMQSRC